MNISKLSCERKDYDILLLVLAFMGKEEYVGKKLGRMGRTEPYGDSLKDIL